MSRRGWIILGAAAVVFVLLAGMVTVGAFVVGSVLSTISPGDRWDERVLDGDGPAKIVVIDVSGEIHGGDSGGSFGDTAGARDVIDQLRQAHDDADVEGIILRLDTPGGAVVASDEIYREVQRVGEDVPVVASMGDVAASGGYYIASAAERIIANPATLTGSIGVIMIVPNLQGTADKLGISTAVIKSGAFKDAGSPLRPLEPEERDLFQRLIDQAYQQFVDAVVAGRGLDEARVKELADGRVYSGTQAKDNGLVDDFGDLTAAWDATLELANIERDETTLVAYETPFSFTDSLVPGFASPVEETKRELGIGFGLKYLYLP